MTIEVTGGRASGMGPSAGELGLAGSVLDTMEDLGVADDLRRLIEEMRAGRVDSDSVMRACSRRLDDVDAQITHVTAALEDASALASAISADTSEVRQLQRYLSPWATGASWPPGMPDFGELTPDALRGRLTEVGLSEGRINEIIAEVDAAGLFDGRHFGPVDVASAAGFVFHTPGDITSTLESLGADLREANSGNERMMISLQSLMQQRTSILQMTTNMLKALDEASDSIIGNMR